MSHTHDARRAGFTLVETLLAALLGALLLAAAASSAGQFSQAMAELQTESADTYENVLARIGRDVRYAWWVDVPARNRLQLVGPDNLVTEYSVVGNSLLVTRPDGTSGSVVTGLQSLVFEESTLQRLREGPASSVSATLASRSIPALAPRTASTMSSSEAYAISFMVPSDAGALSVAGVNDPYTAWQPTTLELTMSKVGNGSLTFTLYPAFGPGRAQPRPGAAALATWTQNLSGLPTAVLAVRSAYIPPAVTTTINVPVLPASLEPGVAYTLVMTVSTGATAIFAAGIVAANCEQMSRSSAGGGGDDDDEGDDWSASSVVVPFAVRGNATCGSTRASDVTTQVRATLQAESGATYVGSACVYSQVMAEDPWLGVVPGELPAGP